jgi:hypothetical protein
MDKTASSINFVMDIKLYHMQKTLSDRQNNLDRMRIFNHLLLSNMDYSNFTIWTIIARKKPADRRVALHSFAN